MHINTIIIKEKLLELKKYNGTIVFSFGDYYIQFLKESNKRTIYCEVVSNNFLKSISKKQIQLIKNLNFKIDTENFYKNYKTNEIELILNETENIFSMIFQVNYNNSIEVDNMIEYHSNSKPLINNLNQNKSPVSGNPDPITIQERIESNFVMIGFVIIVVCIVIWMTASQSSGSSYDSNNQQNTQSESITAYHVTQDTYAATNEDTFHKMFKYFKVKDEEAINTLLYNGEIINLHQGTELYLLGGNGFTFSIVRKKGSTQELWVVPQHITQN